MEEVWKNYIYNYDVSNFGRLRNNKTGNILKIRKINKGGYFGTVVTLGSKKQSKMIVVHRAVAEMFIPNPENKSQVNHIDGNKSNNYVDNLEWVTPKENTDHAIRTGLSNRVGCNNGQSKLTNDNVIYIREHYTPNNREFSYNALARKFGVSKPVIVDVVKRRSYKNVV